MAQEDSQDTPEALVISALLESGTFEPQRHHLTEDHLECWKKLWQFAVAHQEQTGQAPSLELVKSQFPTFVFTPNVIPSWAVHQLHREHGARTLRKTMKKAIRHLDDEELEEAHALLSSVERPRVARKAPMGMFDHEGVTQSFAVSKVPVPYATLMKATGGVAPEDMWLVASRPNEGKTFTLCKFAGKAVEAGLNVGYLSLEMPARTINARTRRCMATPAELTQLDSNDQAVVKKAIDHMRERITGSFSVMDPSHGRFTSPVVREALEQYDFVLLDHVGLMYTASGKRAIEDWRAQAEISNDLRQDVLAAGTACVAGVQINRTAENAGSQAPKLGQLSQSDALGQDADVVVTFRSLSETVRTWSLEKNREGAKPKWWTLFDARRARFEELSKDQAYEQVAADEDRAA